MTILTLISYRYKFQMKTDHPTWTLATCGKMANYLYKRLSNQVTFWPPSVERTPALENYLESTFGENVELPLYKKYSPHLCVGPMIQSLRSTEEIINQHPEFNRPDESQSFVTKSYCKRKIKKLAEFGNLSTRSRKKLATWMKIAITNLVKRVNASAAAIELSDQDISDEIYEGVLYLLEDPADATYFLASIRKTVQKITGNNFRPKISSRLQGM